MYPVTERTVAEIAPWPEPPPCLHHYPSRVQSVDSMPPPPPSSAGSWIRSTGMRRRPESVFSRRGPTTPVEQVVPVDERFNAPEAPRKSSKKKPGSRRFPTEEKRGTILHAVPKVLPEELSPRAMTAAFINRCIAAPLPKHPRSTSESSSLDFPELKCEIYSISEETAAPCVASERKLRHSSSFPTTPYIPMSSTSLTNATKHSFLGKKKKRASKQVENATEVGVWRDGKVHWASPQSSISIIQRPEDAFVAELDSTPVSSLASQAKVHASGNRNKRPSIQVVIPEQPRFPNSHLPKSPTSLTQTALQGPSSASGSSVAGDLISSRLTPPKIAARHPRVHNSMGSPIASQSLLRKATTEAHPGQLWDPVGYTALRQVSVSTSTASTGSARDGDAFSSNYSNSNRTSLTSVDDNGEAALRPKSHAYLDGLTASQLFSVGSPIAAGVFDESTSVIVDTEDHTAPGFVKDQAPAKQEHMKFPMAHPGQLYNPPTKNHCEGAARQLTNNASTRKNRSMPLSRQNLGAVADPPRTVLRTIPTSSPTLSEAETALEEQLCCFNPTPIDYWHREEPPLRESLPPPPRKSSKRKLLSMPVSIITGLQPASQQGKMAPDSCESAIPRDICPNVAESVLCGILRSCQSLGDLFSLALVNGGFYYVFKRHELEIMQEVLKNESPPAWEFRKVSSPYPPILNTSASFYGSHKHDKIVVMALKSLVLTRCQSFLRPETVLALVIDGSKRAQRMDDAFWRIWTFCKLFGCGKNREDDILGQTDWLRGGSFFHQTDAQATWLSGSSIEPNSVLTNASSHFAMGNPGGLSAEQLYDMTEIWTCLGVLLSGLEGRTAQAREFGVFEQTDVRGGDIDGEERMLDEWIYYLLTLGPDVVLYLASPSNNSEPDAFEIAQDKGWIKWTPPLHESSRCTFLKESVSRVYEEKIAAMAAAHPRHNLEVKRNMRERIAAHKAEIRMRKRSGLCPLVRMSMERPISDWEGVFRSLGEPQRTASLCSGRTAAHNAPLPSMPELPAMGENEIRTTVHTRSISAPQPQSQVSSDVSTDAASPVTCHVAHSSGGGPPSPPGSSFPYCDPHSSFTTPRPTAHPSNVSAATVSSVSTPRFFDAASSLFPEPASAVSTLADHRQNAAVQQSKQAELKSLGGLSKANSDLAQNSSEKAIFRIVEMGFTPDQAKYALMKTDLGDGLRVDRAVELLLRGSYGRLEEAGEGV